MDIVNKKTGIVNCLRLHILADPKAEAEVVCKVRYLTEVLVDLDSSTDEYYKVCTAIGAEGYCIKDLITIT